MELEQPLSQGHNVFFVYREQCKIDLKVQFSSILLRNFGIRAANWASEKCKGGVLMFQGQIGEIPLLSPGKFSIFLILALFSIRPSQKLGTPIHLKLLFRIGMEQGYSLKKFRIDKLKITVSISNCKKTVFNYVLCKKPSKAPGN